MRKVIAAVLVFVFSLGIGGAYANSAPSQTPIFYGPTNEYDHLYRIAIKLKPSLLVNVDQMMIALLKYNPEAFDIPNINAIKPGKVLRLPRLALIRDISPRFAYYEVNRQNAAWQERLERAAKKAKKLAQRKKSCHEEKHLAADATKATTKSVAKADLKITEVAKQISATPSQDTRLATLEMQNSTLQGQLITMGQQLSSVQQQLAQMKIAKAAPAAVSKLTAKFEPGSIKSFVSAMQQKLGTVGFVLVVIFGFLFIIFFLRGLFAGSSKKKVREVPVAPSKEEYDFMGSEESIPSKLNLAHAYIDMGNFTGARDVLNEIIIKGDPAQQAEARELLNKFVK